MAEAQELATVYIAVVPSFQGMEGNLGALFGAPLTKGAEDAGEKSGKKFSDKFSGVAQAGMAAAGLAIGGGIMAGMNSVIDKESAGNKLTAQLALTPEQSARYGKLAGELYADNYGGSMGEVNDALKSVTQNIGGMGTASDETLSGVTAKVMSTAQAFDQDLASVTTATGQLMKNGLAKDADEALDIITRGLQTNGGSADDMLDSFSEYAPLFKSLGVDGAQGLGMINQAMSAGALNTDYVSDALKEFAIRSKDGSTASADAYELMGLNAEQMTAKMAKGGPEAAAGLQTVMDKLRGMEDPVKRNAAAIGLFGGKGEDLAASLFAIDPSKATGALGEVAGAAGKVDEQLSKGTGPQLASLQRGLESAFGGMLTSVLPILEPVIGFLTQFAPVLGPIALGLAAVTAAQWLWNAAQLANPITWIVLGIVALVAGIIWLVANWDTAMKFLLALWAPIGDFFTGLWNGIVTGIGVAWEWIKGALANAWNFILGVFMHTSPVGLIILYWDEILAMSTAVWGAISGFFSGIWGDIVANVERGVGEVVGWFSNLVNDVTGFFNGLVSQAADFGRNIVQGIIDGVRGMGANVMQVFGDLLPGWVTGPFKDALGIHSPSRVFKVMGQDTGDGFMLGTKSREAAIAKSMRNMVAQLPDTPRTSTAPANVIANNAPVEQFEFNVHPSAGMNEVELAELMARRVAKQKRR